MATIPRRLDQTEMLRGCCDYKLGPKGSAYVYTRLSAGNSLARAVAPRFRASGTECIARLPYDTPSDRLWLFNEGGFGASDDPRRWLVEMVRTYLEENADGLVVFEDALSRRGDAILERFQSRIVYHESEVYHILTVEDASEYAIATSLSEAEAPQQLVCLFTRNASGALPSASEITDEELAAWANAAEIVAVSAYDGETYIVCAFARGR